MKRVNAMTSAKKKKKSAIGFIHPEWDLICRLATPKSASWWYLTPDYPIWTDTHTSGLKKVRITIEEI